MIGAAFLIAFWAGFAIGGPILATLTTVLTFAALGIGYEWSRFAAEAEDHG